MDAANEHLLDSLLAFLDLTEDGQLALIAILDHAELLKLHNAYVEHVAQHRTLRPVEYKVFEEMLRRLEPGEYAGDATHDTMATDDSIQEALQPDALKRIREETYKYTVRPLIVGTDDEQERFITSLDTDELRSLLELLNRYAKECGRSTRCRQLERRIKDRIHERRDA